MSTIRNLKTVLREVTNRRKRYLNLAKNKNNEFKINFLPEAKRI